MSVQVLAPKAGSGKRKQGVAAPQGAAAPVRPGDVEVHLANVACTLLILGDALFQHGLEFWNFIGNP